MLKSNKHIEIVRTNIKGLSSLSQESCDSIFAVLAKHYTEVGVTTVNSLSDLGSLVDSRPDLVFLGMEYISLDPALGFADPNKVWLSDYLDGYKIAYTGSTRTAHELGRNKPLAKQCVLDAGLSTSPYHVIDQQQSLGGSDVLLAYPMFVKPANRGGGLGIDSDSVVHTFEQLHSKVHSITTKLRSAVLIEEYLSGREFSVAILKDKYSDGYLAMPIELIAPPDKNGSRLLSGQIKSSNAEQAIEVTDPDVKSMVIELALAVFCALGARDYGRIDIRLDAAGMPQFLEANLIPSLISGYGSFPKACIVNIGLEYEPMILAIAKLGLTRDTDDFVNGSELTTISNSMPLATEFIFEPV